MLPSPNCKFNLPSVNDDIELNCRLYFPRPLSGRKDKCISGFAIFAHPYAPLGGCYDDPIVQSMGSLLLKHHVVLCTFNFRGAMESPGRTSWTGKPELADYVSVYTFMLHLLGHSDIMDHVVLKDRKPILILGGYSYGSMIASYLPDFDTVRHMTSSQQAGSSDHEIELRANEISKVLLSYLDLQRSRAQTENNLHSGRMTGSPPGRETMIGGYESETATHRMSRDFPRRSIDHIRHKFGHKSGSDNTVQQILNHSSESVDPTTHTVDPFVAYILVSPLLQPVSGFTTVFSRLNFHRPNHHNLPVKTSKSMTQNLTENPTLVVYGDRDMFTSARKLRKWTEELHNIGGSLFSLEEIEGAGHFWHEAGAHESLSATINTWLQSLLFHESENR